MASTSCSAALELIRRGEECRELVRRLGEEQPADFFRLIVEPLSDSFDPADARAYEELMRPWIAPARQAHPQVPERVETVYVLSRVTLGADIKITSIVLDAMKPRFPGAGIVLAGGRKSAELFATDSRIEHLEVEYPRTGPVSCRIEFARQLRSKLEGRGRIVIDPDSRLTQLGLVPACEPERYFHFPSRTRSSAGNLSDLTRDWLLETFGVSGEAFIAPSHIRFEADRPCVAVSFGVGENESKRIGGDFETKLIGALGERFRTLWVDRGAGGEESRRVTAAVENSGANDRVRFWEGSFAGFASIISQCDVYVGYDSAGQHAAAAAGTPLISIFAGAVSERFQRRWAPSGRGSIQVVNPQSSVRPEELAECAAAIQSGRQRR